VSDVENEEGVEDVNIKDSVISGCPPDEVTVKKFTVVSYAKYGVYSVNSSEIEVTIDKTTPEPPAKTMSVHIMTSE
jgi:hypothetical protein